MAKQLRRVLPCDAPRIVIGNALFAQLSHEHCLGVGPRRVGVGIVGLDEDVVDADAVSYEHAGVVVERAEPEVAAQHFRRRLVDVAPCGQVAELVLVAMVEPVHDPRDPADAAFR